MSTSAGPQRGSIVAACVGAAGGLGNQLFQVAFATSLLAATGQRENRSVASEISRPAVHLDEHKLEASVGTSPLVLRCQACLGADGANLAHGRRCQCPGSCWGPWRNAPGFPCCCSFSASFDDRKNTVVGAGENDCTAARSSSVFPVCASSSSLEFDCRGCYMSPMWNEASVVCDRPMLSHGGWRRWALSKNPLRTLPGVEAFLKISESSSKDDAKPLLPLSGRAFRRHAHQVSEHSLATGVAASSFSQSHCLLWCWGQVHTRHYSARRDELLELFAIVPSLRVLLEHARASLLVAALKSAPVPAGEPHNEILRAKLQHISSRISPVLVVHIRAGEGYSSLLSQDREKSLTLGEWADPSGIFWSTPVHWIGDFLQRQLKQNLSRSYGVVVCSDAPGGELEERTISAALEHGARFAISSSLVQKHSPETWQAILDRPEVKHADEAQLLFDFLLMQDADVLAGSNSTLSLWAALLATKTDHVFARPDPATESLVEVDPWCCLPLLRGTL